MYGSVPGTLWESWGVRLWTACWQGAIVVGLVWLLCRLPKLSPALKNWLWWLASLKLVLSLLSMVRISLPILPPRESPLAAINDRMDLLAPHIVGKASSIYIPSNFPSETTGRAAVAIPFLSPTEWIVAVWVMGVVGFILYAAYQGLRLRQVVKNAQSLCETSTGEEARLLGVTMGLAQRPNVYESDRVSAPMVVGIVHPVLLLPMRFAKKLTPDELRMALAHELAHIKRHDLPMAIVPTLAQALFYFYPPLWLLVREWATEREAACDIEALAVTGASPKGYGNLLMKIVATDHRGALAPALGATASYHSLKKRLITMKHFVPSTSRQLRIAAATLSIAGLLLVLPWEVTAQDAAQPKNLLTNSGFELGMQGWTPGSIPLNSDVPIHMSIDSSEKHGGSSSVRFERTGQGFFPIKTLGQHFAVSGQTKIKVGVWAKATDAHKATVAVMFNQPSGEGKIEWGAYIGDQSGSSAVNHDWKHYTSVLSIPSGTDDIMVMLEMYGPGTVWMDDVSAQFMPDETPVSSAATDAEGDPLADIKDVPNQDLRAGRDPLKRYFLIGAKPGANPPAEGYKLLVVMPGGDGSAEFNPFVRRIWKNALPEGYLIAQLVAPKWSEEQFNTIVWPTKKQRWLGMKFASEEFIESVVADVKSQIKVDTSKVFTLSWSSGGPPAYSASLSSSSIKGSFVAMSVFHPDELPSLLGARGRAYYILHSPEDFIPIAQARAAEGELRKAGALTTLETYEGGHGWHGDVFETIRKGVSWLEGNVAK